MDGVLTDSADLEADRPEVRQDLNLYNAGEDEFGRVVWRLHDPLANRFYQLTEDDVELLALVGGRSASEIADEAARLGLARHTDEHIDELLNFLRKNNLVRGDDLQKRLYQETLAFAKQRHWWQMALRNPLFFRIPLWNPDRFLDATLPYVAWLGTRSFLWFLLILGLTGIYLVLQQLDQFLTTFLHFFSWSGLAVYLVALFSVKVLHELGHAYVAKQQGCRVPVIGVAFMVGWPILFTDTSDAWKIPDRDKRLRIGFAGVGVELAIAVLSLFLWVLAPEGAVKSAFFLLATTTWLLSIFVNFNPLMRFDGYYLLSDLTDMPNLEPRTFSMARWWLREKLFGLRVPPPEEPRLWYVFFAFAVWTYRFFLFLGIALLVYSYFFKAAGIALFILEIVYFIARPVFNEVKEWWKLRDQITLNPTTRRTLILLAAGVGLLFIPWQNDVSTAAVFKAKSNDLYLHTAGRLVSLKPVGGVLEGESVFEFESPALDLRIEEARNRYEELSWSRSSLGFNERLRRERLIVESDLRTQNQKLRTLVEEQLRLTITAPFDGLLVDISPEAVAGDWLPVGQKLATVVDPSDVRVEAYLPEDQLSRIELGMPARFYPENPEHGVIDLEVADIEFMGTPELDNLYLASTFGGNVAVRESPQGDLLTVRSHYKIHLMPVDKSLTVNQVVRGTAVIEGNRISLFNQIRRRIVAVFIRETGF